MIRNAKSLQEIARLEKELGEGKIPGGILDSRRAATRGGGHDDDDDEDDEDDDDEMEG